MVDTKTINWSFPSRYTDMNSWGEAKRYPVITNNAAKADKGFD